MDTAKIKSVLIFNALSALLFYFAHTAARESTFSVEDTDQSAQFLDTVAFLNDLQFDLDFVNSLGDTAVKTDVYVRPLSLSDSGRDNPFRRSSPSVLFEGPQDVFSDQSEVRSIQEELSSPASQVLSEEQVLAEEQSTAVLPGAGEQQDSIAPSSDEQSFTEEQEEEQDVSLPEERDAESQSEVSPPDPSSATLTR